LVFQRWVIIARFVREVFPLVDHYLEKWNELAEKIPDSLLRKQALASIREKKFHCQGGSVFALMPGVERDIMVRFIVAFQTISDYLDNLCDRAGCTDERAFRQLHLAMTEALSLQGSISGYYQFYSNHNDGGYLQALVKECRFCLAHIPSFPLVLQKVVQLTSLYADLQCLKHLKIEEREDRMLKWAGAHLDQYPDISPWEFAAACGSTLAVFLLCAAAFNPQLKEEDTHRMQFAYFPYICGFHILLDYFIDQAEDRREGDLNFIFYYSNSEQVRERLTFFLIQALEHTRSLSFPVFHRTVVEGLAAMYLSDPKALTGSLKGTGQNLLRLAGKGTEVMHLICRMIRKKNLL